MVRVTNYFDTQIRIPSEGVKGFGRNNGHQDHPFDSPLSYKPNSTSEKKMSDEQMVSWYSKILESVRIRYRKLQRFARYVITPPPICKQLTYYSVR
jgi:mitogen-activated protein kinase kinase kinase